MFVTAGSRAGRSARSIARQMEQKGLLLRQAGSAPRNRIVNGALQISQENGDAAGTTDAYYVADQFCVERNTSAGTITAQRVQSTTPGGARDRARITITTADTSLAAGEYLQFRTRLEGVNVADLLWGTASARPIVLRFLFKGPSGTYAARIGNSAGNRSYIALFSPSAANTDEIIEIAVPGDTSGTWLADTSIGMQLSVVLACGSTFQGSTGWQSGNILGTSGVSNGMGTGSAVFEFGEFGMYLDADASGTAPSWELPSRDAELLSCQRFYCKSFPEGIVPADGAGAAEHLAAFAYATTDAQVQRIFFPVEMRATPSASFYRSSEGSSAGKWARYAVSGGWANTTATAIANGGADISAKSMCVQITLAAGFSVGAAYIAAGHWVASARL